MTIDLKNHRFSPYTVIVSRVQRVIDNPSKISPISCTMVSVEDSYYDVDGDYTIYDTIAGSRLYATKVLKGNAGISVDLSKLRPKGTTGSGGLVAQGVTNFMHVYSAINSEVRRGNSFKNGAVVLCLAFTHPDFEDFLDFGTEGHETQGLLPWAKKGVTVNADMWLPEYADRREKLFTALAKGQVFVSKERYNAQGNRLYDNVCYGLLLLSRSTCTLAPVNLGKIRDPRDIPYAMLSVFRDLDVIWNYFNETREDHFLDPAKDKQIGLGYVGLANMLAHFGVKYSELLAAMQKQLAGSKMSNSTADQIAQGFADGYKRVEVEAKALKYERVFAIEPTASCSFKQKDLRGFVTTPEISPPVCHPVTKVTRRQAADGYIDAQYPLNVEVAGVDVDWQTYEGLCSCFQEMADRTGLAQGISYNWWLEKPVNEDTFKDWWESNLKTIYYRWKTSSADQDKTTVGEQLEGAEAFWGDDDEDEIDTVAVAVGNDEIACECGS